MKLAIGERDYQENRDQVDLWLGDLGVVEKHVYAFRTIGPLVLLYAFQDPIRVLPGTDTILRRLLIRWTRAHPFAEEAAA